MNYEQFKHAVEERYPVFIVRTTCDSPYYSTSVYMPKVFLPKTFQDFYGKNQVIAWFDKGDNFTDKDVDSIQNQLDSLWFEYQIATAKITHSKAPVTQERLHKVLEHVGWGPRRDTGEEVVFQKESNGWRVGNGIIVTPWYHSGVPVHENAEEALLFIEQDFKQ